MVKGRTKEGGIVKFFVILMIRLYQKLLSPLLGQRCRFYPSCSEYARISFEHKSFGIALFKTVGRLVRCQPLSRGGLDYP